MSTPSAATTTEEPKTQEPFTSAMTVTMTHAVETASKVTTVLGTTSSIAAVLKTTSQMTAAPEATSEMTTAPEAMSHMTPASETVSQTAAPWTSQQRGATETLEMTSYQETSKISTPSFLPACPHPPEGSVTPDAFSAQVALQYCGQSGRFEEGGLWRSVVCINTKWSETLPLCKSECICSTYINFETVEVTSFLQKSKQNGNKTSRPEKSGQKDVKIETK